MPYIGRLHEDNTHERYVTYDEEDKILNLLYTWGKTEHAIAVIILIDTGMRSGELFSLKRDDVNFDLSKNGVINIWKQNTKTAKSRTIPLTERASKALRIVYNEKKSPTDRLFPHDRFWLINVWDKVKLALGLEDCPVYHPHILRHTFGSRLAQAGVPLQKIAYLMGHTSIRTTMRYAHLCPTAYEGIIDVLDDLEKTRRLDSQALHV
jgi:integrase